MTYVIVTNNELSQQMVDDCVETSLDTVRKNDGVGGDSSKAILKYEGAKPASIAAYTDYTHAEILVELAKPEWNPAE